MKRVLISPLNWGLGHATRMIPIIRWLETRSCVTLGGNGASFEFLKKEFPSLKTVEIPGVEVWLSNHKWLNYIGLLLQSPYFLWYTWKENRWLKKNHTAFDIVISDNRYGLSHPMLTSILVTHQTAPPVPFFKKFTSNVVASFLNSFQEIWIPDEEHVQLTKRFWCNKKLLPSIKFIGWLSSWNSTKANENKYWVVLASGPEPSKSEFVEMISSKVSKPIVVCDGMSGMELMQVINDAAGIISKAGYSTIMDVLLSRKKAVLLPTPGQKEQETLSEHEWLNKQIQFMSWKEFVATKQLNLEHVPTPTMIDIEKKYAYFLANLIQ